MEVKDLNIFIRLVNGVVAQMARVLVWQYEKYKERWGSE
jgi:hypothetical protein